MRKRTSAKRREKLQTLESAISLAMSVLPPALTQSIWSETDFCCLQSVTGGADTECSMIAPLASEDRSSRPDAIDWTSLPDDLDPGAGELSNERAERKRSQVESLVALVEQEFSVGDNEWMASRSLVEFGAGSGHVTLLLAYRHPSLHFVLAERKEYCIHVAKQRIERSRLANVELYCGDVRDFPMGRIGFGVGLHCCGLLTDIALALCARAGASCVLSPCCYGQVGRPAPASEGFESLAGSLSIESQIATYRSPLLFPENVDLLRILSSGADITYSLSAEECRRGVTDLSFNKDAVLSRQCMRILDADRLLRVSLSSRDDQGTDLLEPAPKEGYYLVRMSSLFPVSCSPKNNVIICRRISYHSFAQIPNRDDL